MSGFHGAFATGVASQQGTLTLPDTWFRPQFWDLLMLQLFRPNSSNLPCLYSTFHLEYPLVLSRFCLEWLFILNRSLLFCISTTLVAPLVDHRSPKFYVLKVLPIEHEPRIWSKFERFLFCISYIIIFKFKFTS